MTGNHRFSLSAHENFTLFQMVFYIEKEKDHLSKTERWSYLSSILLQKVLLNLKKTGGKVHIEGMGIVEAANLLPEGIHLLSAVIADILQLGKLVNQFTI